MLLRSSGHTHHNMHKKTLLWTGLLLLTLMLAACSSGEEEQGIDLAAAGGRPSPTATPIPAEPDATADDSADRTEGSLTGRLLLLRGSTFELYDLATGESTVFETTHAFSPAFFNATGTHASFSQFPDYGVLNLLDQTVTTVSNNASNPNGFGISPDGEWLVAFTGQFTARMQVFAVDGSAAYNVASTGQTFFNSVWTDDSKLIWWAVEDEPDIQVFDPLTGESTPLGDADPAIPGFANVSPDGSQAAIVPVAFRPNDLAANPNACFDSYVALLEPPFTFASRNDQGDTVWTQAGLVASSPQWLDDDRLLFVQIGTGDCGDVQGDPDRMVMLYDTSTPGTPPAAVVGPLGNADDFNDRPQRFGKAFGHLYSPSPDAQYIAWITGGVDAHVSEVNITNLATGETQVIIRTTFEQAGDAGDYIENFIFRQVVWLP